MDASKQIKTVTEDLELKTKAFNKDKMIIETAEEHSNSSSSSSRKLKAPKLDLQIIGIGPMSSCSPSCSQNSARSDSQTKSANLKVLNKK